MHVHRTGGFILGTAGLLLLTGCTKPSGPPLRADAEYGDRVARYIGLPKADLVKQLGEPDDALLQGDPKNRSSTSWLYYKKYATTFGLSRSTGMVMKAIYPTIDGAGRVDANQLALGYGLAQGMTPAEVEQHMGAPSLKAPLAWIYCDKRYSGAHGLPVFLRVDFKYGAIPAVQSIELASSEDIGNGRCPGAS